MSGKRQARIVSVQAHLRNQVLDAVVFFLASRPGDKVDVNVAAVDVLVEVEDVHLEQGLGAIKRRPRTDARNRILDANGNPIKLNKRRGKDGRDTSSDDYSSLTETERKKSRLDDKSALSGRAKVGG